MHFPKSRLEKREIMNSLKKATLVVALIYTHFFCFSYAQSTDTKQPLIIGANSAVAIKEGKVVYKEGEVVYEETPWVYGQYKCIRKKGTANTEFKWFSTNFWGGEDFGVEFWNAMPNQTPKKKRPNRSMVFELSKKNLDLLVHAGFDPDIACNTFLSGNLRDDDTQKDFETKNSVCFAGPKVKSIKCQTPAVKKLLPETHEKYLVGVFDKEYPSDYISIEGKNFKVVKAIPNSPTAIQGKDSDGNANGDDNTIAEPEDSSKSAVEDYEKLQQAYRQLEQENKELNEIIKKHQHDENKIKKYQQDESKPTKFVFDTSKNTTTTSNIFSDLSLVYSGLETLLLLSILMAIFYLLRSLREKKENDSTELELSDIKKDIANIQKKLNSMSSQNSIVELKTKLIDEMQTIKNSQLSGEQIQENITASFPKKHVENYIARLIKKMEGELNPVTDRIQEKIITQITSFNKSAEKTIHAAINTKLREFRSENEQLQKINLSLEQENNQLNTKLDSIKNEKERLSENYCSLERDNNQFKKTIESQKEETKNQKELLENELQNYAMKFKDEIVRTHPHIKMTTQLEMLIKKRFEELSDDDYSYLVTEIYRFIYMGYVFGLHRHLEQSAWNLLQTLLFYLNTSGKPNYSLSLTSIQQSKTMNYDNFSSTKNTFSIDREQLSESDRAYLLKKIALLSLLYKKLGISDESLQQAIETKDLSGISKLFKTPEKITLRFSELTELGNHSEASDDNPIVKGRKDEF